ncbi:MAG: hypothetical protein ACRC2T_03380, partial [Thermoguttaceae bacterium]
YEKNPNDLQLVDYYGTLLADTTDTGELKLALEFWRGVEKKLENKEKSEPELFRKSKLTIINIHQKLGNHEQAKKLSELYRILYPGK